MPTFGKRSKMLLATADQRLQDLFNEVIKHYDCAVIEGHRDEAKQNEAFKLGMSKLNWPNSPHNKTPSMAVDVAPYPVDWTDIKRFYHFAGYVLAVANQLGIKIRHGGDWDQDLDFKDQTFFDLPHFELVEEKDEKNLSTQPINT